MIMHVHHAGQFHIAVAATKIWLVLAWGRVAIALPRCRPFAACFGSSLLATAACVLLSGNLPQLTDHHATWDERWDAFAFAPVLERCVFFDRNLHSRMMPLSFTSLLDLKRASV
jgi:hypothetical protein